jgi:hypothetical protein
MKPEPLLPVFAKIERAEAQIDDLNTRIGAFFETSPYELASEIDPDGTQEVWRFKLTRRLPHVLSVVAGEILHNLRSPLDQLAGAIALQSHRSEAGVCFPFGRDVNEFETELRKQKKLPPDAIALIRAAQPYRGGNNLLWQLHHLNRRDKHRVGLMPVNLRTATSLSTLIVFTGQVMTVGFRNGQHLVRDGRNLSQHDPGKQPCIVRNGDIIMVNGSPAMSFEPNVAAGDDDMEILTATPGTKFYCDFQPSLNVSFRNIEGLEREPVVAVLHQMRQLVKRLLLTFEARFFR